MSNIEVLELNEEELVSIEKIKISADCLGQMFWQEKTG